MFLLTVLLVWNVLRRQSALTEVRRLAEREVQASHDRERLTQLTSHGLRTPLTIARGYVELIQSRAAAKQAVQDRPDVPDVPNLQDGQDGQGGHNVQDAQDLLVVADELDRLSRVSDRLVRMIGLQDEPSSELVDLDAIPAQSLERWRVVAVRSWCWMPTQAPPRDLRNGSAPESTRSSRTRSVIRRRATRSDWSDYAGATT